MLDINIIVAILFGLSAFFILVSFFTKNSLKRDIEDLKDYSFEQSQEIYRLRERLTSLETFTGLPMTQTMTFTSELRSLSDLTKDNIFNLYTQGRTPDEISILADIPVETVQILIDRYIEESTK